MCEPTEAHIPVEIILAWTKKYTYSGFKVLAAVASLAKQNSGQVGGFTDYIQRQTLGQESGVTHRDRLKNALIEVRAELEQDPLHSRAIAYRLRVLEGVAQEAEKRFSLHETNAPNWDERSRMDHSTSYSEDDTDTDTERSKVELTITPNDPETDFRPKSFPSPDANGHKAFGLKLLNTGDLDPESKDQKQTPLSDGNGDPPAPWLDENGKRKPIRLVQDEYTNGDLDLDDLRDIRANERELPKPEKGTAQRQKADGRPTQRKGLLDWLEREIEGGPKVNFERDLPLLRVIMPQSFSGLVFDPTTQNGKVTLGAVKEIWNFVFRNKLPEPTADRMQAAYAHYDKTNKGSRPRSVRTIAQAYVDYCADHGEIKNAPSRTNGHGGLAAADTEERRRKYVSVVE